MFDANDFVGLPFSLEGITLTPLGVLDSDLRPVDKIGIIMSRGEHVLPLLKPLMARAAEDLLVTPHVQKAWREGRIKEIDSLPLSQAAILNFLQTRDTDLYAESMCVFGLQDTDVIAIFMAYASSEADFKDLSVEETCSQLADPDLGPATQAVIKRFYDEIVDYFCHNNRN